MAANTSAFGRYIRKLRIDNDMILKDLAEGLAVSSAYLSSLELGKKKIPQKIVEKIASYFSLDEGQRKELEHVVRLSQPELTICLKNRSMEDRELVSAFARRYKNLASVDKEKLRAFLEDGAD